MLLTFRLTLTVVPLVPEIIDGLKKTEAVGIVYGVYIAEAEVMNGRLITKRASIVIRVFPISDLVFLN